MTIKLNKGINWKQLKKDIENDISENQSKDSASWGYEEGVLLTANQADFLVKRIAELESHIESHLKFYEEVNDEYDVKGIRRLFESIFTTKQQYKK